MIPKASLKVVVGDPIRVNVMVEGRSIAFVPIAEIKAAYQWICDLEVAAEFAACDICDGCDGQNGRGVFSETLA